MIFNLKFEVDRQQFKDYCNELYKQGQESGCVVEVKKKHVQRSLSQNSYLHVCLGLLACNTGYTIEEVKTNIFKKLVNRKLFVTSIDSPTGEKMTYLRSSKDLDTAEMTQAIERFRNYCSQFCDLYIPSPEEHDAIVEAQKQIDKFANYI